MKSIKKEFIISIVVLCCFCLVSTGLMQPIQTAKAMETLQDSSSAIDKFISTLSDISVDATRESENKYIITMDNMSTTFEEIVFYPEIGLHFCF
jgi:hypothetical protein